MMWLRYSSQIALWRDLRTNMEESLAEVSKREFECRVKKRQKPVARNDFDAAG